MSEYPLFDKSVFRVLVSELGAEGIVELLDVFLGDTCEKIGAMAANCGNRPATKREAHAIKSSAATFGFTGLSRLAWELETGSETMSEAELKRSVDALRRSFEATSSFACGNLVSASLETI